MPMKLTTVTTQWYIEYCFCARHPVSHNFWLPQWLCCNLASGTSRSPLWGNYDAQEMHTNTHTFTRMEDNQLKTTKRIGNLRVAFRFLWTKGLTCLWWESPFRSCCHKGRYFFFFLTPHLFGLGLHKQTKKQTNENNQESTAMHMPKQ